MGFLMVFATLLTITNLIIILGLNIYNIIEDVKWKKERKKLDEEFDKILKDMIDISKAQVEEKPEEE